MLILNFPNIHYALCSPFLPCLFASLSSHFFYSYFIFLIFLKLLFLPIFHFPLHFSPRRGFCDTQHYYMPALTRMWGWAFKQEFFRKSPYALSNSYIIAEGITETEKIKSPENFMDFPLVSQLDDLSQLERA